MSLAKLKTAAPATIGADESVSLEELNEMIATMGAELESEFNTEALLACIEAHGWNASLDDLYGEELRENDINTEDQADIVEALNTLLDIDTEALPAGFGLTIVGILASGIPVIGPIVQGVIEMIQHSENTNFFNGNEFKITDVDGFEREFNKYKVHSITAKDMIPRLAVAANILKICTGANDKTTVTEVIDAFTDVYGGSFDGGKLKLPKKVEGFFTISTKTAGSLGYNAKATQDVFNGFKTCRPILEEFQDKWFPVRAAKKKAIEGESNLSKPQAKAFVKVLKFALSQTIAPCVSTLLMAFRAHKATFNENK